MKKIYKKKTIQEQHSEFSEILKKIFAKVLWDTFNNKKLNKIAKKMREVIHEENKKRNKKKGG